MVSRESLFEGIFTVCFNDKSTNQMAEIDFFLENKTSIKPKKLKLVNTLLVKFSASRVYLWQIRLFNPLSNNPTK